ncbi:Trk family potassium uptake protein [bacterium]|jgi:trk system potassium uptake protein|nr:Trk family potassium uptake protein [bacterium]
MQAVVGGVSFATDPLFILVWSRIMRSALANISPGRLLILSIIGAILTGTILLMLPFSRTAAVPFLDLLFIATSATCVTGLKTIPLTTFTLFGKGVLLVLIQIGGLGLVTMSLFMVSFFVDFGFSTQLMVGRILELEGWRNIRRLIAFIVLFTLIVELLGAGILYSTLRHSHTTGMAIFYSLFHSVSSFCNAGFIIFADGARTLVSSPLIMLVTASLITIGGLGFFVWSELLGHLIWPKKTPRKLSLHTRLVLQVTVYVTLTAALLIWFLERKNGLASMSTSNSFFTALFNAISYRTAGFSTLSIPNLELATLIVVMLAAFIGSSPGSTGSGIKTTVFAIVSMTVISSAYGKPTVEVHGRRIPRDQIAKAIAIVGLSIAWVLLITFLLLITEKGLSLIDVLLESVSAFTTVGLSRNISANLTSLGKMLVVLSMIIGRVGSLTLILALKKTRDKTDIQFPEERVMIG